MSTQNTQNASIAEAYYKAFGEKNFAEMEKYLGDNVQFVAPLDSLSGKQSVMEAAKGFANAFKTIKVRAKFGSMDQAAIVYDLELPTTGVFSSTALLTFHEGLITKIELFYDARPFVKE
jgi:hypothetical protein